ncbi:MAG: ester cyclase [Pseudomonas sp.]|uniref:ester cyclase n=1 Tax=Pseudomonas sp. TaxID=306 RepID=UPI003919B2B4
MSNLESNKALTRREQEEFWAGGNAALADVLFAAQVTEGDGRVVTPTDLTAQMQMQRNAAPDLQIRVLDQIAEGDRVVSRLEITGTHLGEWQGIPPTGRRFAMTGMVMRRIAGDKIVERWDSLDWLGAFQQLGLIPAM